MKKHTVLVKPLRKLLTALTNKDATFVGVAGGKLILHVPLTSEVEPGDYVVEVRKTDDLKMRELKPRYMDSEAEWQDRFILNGFEEEGEDEDDLGY